MRVYPNLPLLEHKFLTHLMENGDCKVVETREGEKYVDTNFECLGVFIQNWPNTAGLFDDGGFSGQMICDYYTTVFVEHKSECYAIFQDNDLVYTVGRPSEELLEDIKNHDLKAYLYAKKRYSNE